MNSFPILLKELESDSIETQLDCLQKLLNLVTFDNVNDREEICSKSIEKLIKHLNSSEIKVLRLVASIFHFLGKTPSNQNLIYKSGVIPLLINLSDSSDEELQEKSLSALWSIVTHEESKITIGMSGIIVKLVGLVKNAPDNIKLVSLCILHPLSINDDFEVEIVRFGGIEAVVEFLKTCNDEFKFPCLRVLSNLCYSLPHTNLAFNAGILDPLFNVLKNGPPNALLKACGCLWNLCTNKEIEIDVAKKGGIELLGDVLKNSPSDVQVYAAATLATMTTTNDENQEKISKLGYLELMVKVLTFPPINHTKSAALDNISANVKNIDIVAKNGIEPILEALKETIDPKSHENLTNCVKNLSISENNKKLLPQYGVIELMFSILEGEMHNSLDEAVTTLWNLSIDREVAEKIIEKGGKEVLEKIIKSSKNKDAVEKATNALRSLEPSLEKESEFNKHVMISYNWTHQPLVLKLSKKLKEMGIKIWIDVEQMEGSTLEKMALAVEEASIVLICATPMYQESRACRTEAEYTYQLKKPFIPLILDERRPTGWLGALLGTQLYVDFSKEEDFDLKIGELITLIQKKVTLSGRSPSPTVVPHNPVETVNDCIKWTQDQVDEWLDDFGLDSLKENFREEMVDGIALDQMIQLYKKSSNEKFVWDVMKEIRVEKVGQRLKLRKAIHELASKKYKSK